MFVNARLLSIIVALTYGTSMIWVDYLPILVLHAILEFDRQTL